MNAASLVATSPRRAALLVHAMPLGDRDWLLGSLAPHHRVELELLLDELRELGIPPDETLLHEILATQAQAQAPARPASAVERLEQLAPQQVATLAQLLKREPPQLAATLLGLRAWPWAQALSAALAPVDVTPRQTRAPALAQALCESVLRRLEACTPAEAPRAPAWNRLLPIRWKGKRG
jgi:hypothetical protein